MNHFLALGIFTLIALWIWLHRAGVRATNRHNANNTWANASDTRYPRTPSRFRPFGRKHGLR